MPANRHIGQAVQPAHTRRAILTVFCRSELLAILEVFPVLIETPLATLARMTAFGPAHQTPINQRVQFAKRLFRDYRAVVLGPTPKDRIQYVDQVHLFCRQVTSDV